MAAEAIELHLEGMIEDGEAIPTPAPIETHRVSRQYRGGIWAVVPIDESTLRIKAVRLNITMPERVVDAVDRFAAEHGETRSGLLVRAVSAYIGRQETGALKPAKRGRPTKTNSPKRSPAKKRRGK